MRGRPRVSRASSKGCWHRVERRHGDRGGAVSRTREFLEFFSFVLWFRVSSASSFCRGAVFATGSTSRKIMRVKSDTNVGEEKISKVPKYKWK